jgi:hypothetical protein
VEEPPLTSTQRRLFFAYHQGTRVQCTTFNWPESIDEAVHLRGAFI